MKTKSKISGHIIRSGAAAVFFLFVIVALSSAFNSPNRSPKSVEAATTIPVTNTNDSGAGSLRQTLADANDGNTIKPNGSFEGQVCTYSVLIVEADCGIPADTLRADLLAEGASVVDDFDATSDTPTLAQLEQYDIVVPFSNCGYADGTTLGDNLADYLDQGGVVVAFAFDWDTTFPFLTIGGRWLTDNYTPFNNSGSENFSNGSLNTCTGPLCSGVTTLNAFFRLNVTVASGAALVATWDDNTPLMAYKAGTVGISGYVGDSGGGWSGQFARIIMNSGSYFIPCGTPTPTPTATATFTPTPTPEESPTPTPTATPEESPTPTPTATATFTPTATPEESPTQTPTATATATAAATATATATTTATATPTPTPTAGPPKAPHAERATQVKATSFTAKWHSVGGATGYRLDVAMDRAFVTYVPGYQNLDAGNVTSRDVTGLTPNTNYYYRLRAYNGNGTSPNSNVVRVKTKPH
jgi:hypothetical protein